MLNLSLSKHGFLKGKNSWKAKKLRNINIHQPCVTSPLLGVNDQELPLWVTGAIWRWPWSPSFPGKKGSVPCPDSLPGHCWCARAGILGAIPTSPSGRVPNPKSFKPLQALVEWAPWESQWLCCAKIPCQRRADCSGNAFLYLYCMCYVYRCINP